MKTVAEPDLPTLSAETVEFITNPLAHFLDAFKQHPGGPVLPMGTPARS